jgi:hypothetical protein
LPGASGDKLDAWLAELRRCARYYQLSGPEAVEFAVARLRDSADTWWAALDGGVQATISSVEKLGAALRARFQPVTTARVAREKLHALQQGARHIDDYITEFSKLHAQVPDMAEPDARAQFVRGLRRELAIKLEDVDWETMPLAAVVAKAARVGGRTTAAAQPAGQPASGRATLTQMEMDCSDSALEERISRAVLNVMQSQQTQSTGPNAHTHRGQGPQRARGGTSGGPSARGHDAARIPKVPGVPAEVVERRRAAGECYRCGSKDHTRFDCIHASSSSN